MVADATTEALKDAAETEKQVESDETGKNRENADLIHECREAFGKGSLQDFIFLPPVCCY